MRVLIVSHFFPPHNTIGALRVGKTAKYLRALGHDVRVVCARPPAHEAPDLSAPLEVPATDVHALAWMDVDRAPLWVAGWLRRRGQRQGRHRATAPERGPQAGLPRGWMRLGRLYTALTNVPDRTVGWIAPAVRTGLQVCRDFQPDVIFASGGPFSSLVTGALLAQLTSTPWVGELRDLFVDNHIYRAPIVRRGLDRWLERATLTSAARLITVSEPLADTLRAKYPVPVHVVRNGFDPDDYPPERATGGTGPLRLVFTGRLYGGVCDPRPLLLGLARAVRRGSAIEAHFYLRDDPAPVRDALRAHGLQDHVHVHAPVPYRQSLAAQSEADVLALILSSEPAFRGVFTGKLFEYIGARRAICAIASPDNVAARLVVDHQLGFAGDDPGAIADYLCARAADKAAGTLRPLPHSATEPFTRRAATEAIAAVLADAAGAGAPRA